MTLGEKIKKARRAKRITQERLAKDKITRNMISRIESGKANPSLDTIRHIAKELSMPVSYFLSEDDNLLFYEKMEKIKTIYNAYKTKEYSYCISKIGDFSGLDDELSLILASSFYELGKECLFRGALSSAQKNFEQSKIYAEKTVFDTSYIEAALPLYVAIANNIQAPLLEFDENPYIDGLHNVFDFELYKYVTQDFDYDFSDSIISRHVNAKKAIKKRDYQEAIRLLSEAESMAKTGEYNAFVVFGIYSDLESCYKQLYNFEQAYRYSSKRMSMLEGFKS